MTTSEREQVIAEIVEMIQKYDDNIGKGYEPDPVFVRNAARKLADIDDPQLPEPIEVVMSRSTDIANEWTWPEGWGYAYGIGHENEVGDEGDEVYRVRITPLERIR